MGISSNMDEFNSFPVKMKNTKLKLSDLNPHLMCVLCGGYYIDATTIVECLHSFCRSCIVKHLESSKYCPICEVQVHKTKPLINIRPDKTLQDIVYKLVPGLFANEMRNRRRFYKERPHYIKPNNAESVGEVSGDRKIFVNDENITFSLIYHTGSTGLTHMNDCYVEILPPTQNEKRYFKCPTGVTVNHLKKLLKTKYDLNECNYKIEVYLKDQPLHDDLTLLDISYIYLWKNHKGNLDLTYKIFENIVKRQKLEENDSKTETKEGRKKPLVNHTRLENPPEKIPVKEEDMVVEVKTTVKSDKNENVETKETTVSTVATETTVPVEKEPSQMNNGVPLKGKPEIKVPETAGRTVKENGISGGESKEVQLQISESGVMIVSQVEDGKIVRTMEDAPPKVMNNQLITGLGLGADKGPKGGGEEVKVKPESAGSRTLGEVKPVTSVAPAATATIAPRKPAPKQIKQYKTMRCTPNAWHPVIPKEKLRPTLMKNLDEPKKPLKFFKMRNMPRFLGNPASGVKPMYAEPAANNKAEEKSNSQQQSNSQQTQLPTPQQQQEKKAELSKNKIKILKIDPKTLRPIEKEEGKVTQAPTVPNLLTNPFIPNNNHFLFSDLHLLPPHSGNFSNTKPDVKGSSGGKQVFAGGVFKGAAPNGSYSPICFPSPDATPGFYPFANLGKPQNFPFPAVTDKMDPLLRASRLSPFANLTGFNVAGFHASLPPSISRLLNPHQHFRKVSQNLERKNKDESTKETTKSCDDSLKGKETNEVGGAGIASIVEKAKEGESKENVHEGEVEAKKAVQKKEDDDAEKTGENEKKKEDGEKVEEKGNEGRGSEVKEVKAVEEERKEKEGGGGEGNMGSGSGSESEKKEENEEKSSESASEKVEESETNHSKSNKAIDRDK